MDPPALLEWIRPVAVDSHPENPLASFSGAHFRPKKDAEGFIQMSEVLYMFDDTIPVNFFNFKFRHFQQRQIFSASS